MKKRLLSAAAVFLCALGASAQMMTVSGSQVNDSTGTPLASGTIQFAPVDLSGRPLSYKIGGKGQTLSSPVTATVTAGTFSIQLPDVSATNPTNVCFAVTVVDNVTGDSVLGPGYACVQPSSTVGGWCGSTTCVFDNYIPNNPAIPQETLTGGTGATFTGGTVASPITAPQLNAGDGLLQLGADGGVPGYNDFTFNGSHNVLTRLGLAAKSSGATDLFFDQPSLTNCYSWRFGGFVKSQLCDGSFTPGFPVVLPADPASAMQAATKQYVDAHSGGTFTGGTVSGATVFSSTVGIAAPLSSFLSTPLYEYQNAMKPALTPFSQALQYAATTPINIVVIGDSYSICDLTNCAIGPNVSTNRWPEQLRIALQAKFGSHGTGIVPISRGADIVNDEAWTVSGSTDWSTTSLGPTQSGNNALLHLATGATATFSDARGIAWDTLNLYCMTNSGSGSIAVSIDGGVYTGTACSTTTGSPTAHVVSLATGAAPSAHTVTFTSTGDSYIYGAGGTAGTSGVSVHNLGAGATAAIAWGSSATAQLAFSDLIPGGTQLAVIMLQANDVNQSEGATNFGTYLGNIITHEQALSTTPAVMLAIPPISHFDPTGTTSAPYTAAQLNLCATLTIACVNIQDHGTTINGTKVGFGTTYTASNLWDNVHSPGTHPSDQGALDEAALIYAQLMNPGASGGIGGIATSAAAQAGHKYLFCTAACTVPADSATDFVDAGFSTAATVTLPAYPTNPSGEVVAGPTNPVTVTCFFNSAANCTVSVPSGWYLHTTSSTTLNGTVVLTPGEAATFQWYSATGGALNAWFLVGESGISATVATPSNHEYIFCNDTTTIVSGVCTIPQGTDMALGSYASSFTMVLPNYASNPSGDVDAGPTYTVDASCLGNSTGTCTVQVPSGWFLHTQTAGSGTLNGTFALSPGHSARFVWYSVTGGATNSWALIGNN